MSELHLVAAERPKQIEATTVDPIDVRPGADCWVGPEHERDLAVASVAETTRTNPGEVVATHGRTDPPICDNAHLQLGRFYERHPPRRTSKPAPVTAASV